jgi:transketolase
MTGHHSAFADGVRRIVLEQSKRANVGHIGSCLSIADVLAAIFAVMRGAPDDPDRDRFVLSKGHGALALYAALHLRGALDATALDTFCKDGTPLGVHPEVVVDGIDFATGSLGQGLSVGAGAALAAVLQGSQRRAFVLLSDAECNEGSVWEAVMFAAHQRLGNLIAVVDENGQQALGHTSEVLSLSPLAEKWAAFAWDVHEADGHDVDRLIALFETLGETPDAPHVVIARTTFGKGVSFMEGQVAWHYLPMTDDDYAKATKELEAASR